MYGLKYVVSLKFLSFIEGGRDGEGGKGEGGVWTEGDQVRASMNGKHCQLRWTGHT